MATFRRVGVRANRSAIATPHNQFLSRLDQPSARFRSTGRNVMQNFYLSAHRLRAIIEVSFDAVLPADHVSAAIGDCFDALLTNYRRGVFFDEDTRDDQLYWVSILVCKSTAVQRRGRHGRDDYDLLPRSRTFKLRHIAESLEQRQSSFRLTTTDRATRRSSSSLTSSNGLCSRMRKT